jgi:hypothetical protein
MSSGAIEDVPTSKRLADLKANTSTYSLAGIRHSSTWGNF